MAMNILCLKSLKQICSVETTSVKSFEFANIVTIIYCLGSLQVTIKINCFYMLFAMSNLNESIKLSKLNPYLDTLHSKYFDKPINLFADKKGMDCWSKQNDKCTFFSLVN